MANDVVMQIRISLALKQQLQEHCDEKCMNMSELIRRLILKYLDEAKKS